MLTVGQVRDILDRSRTRALKDCEEEWMGDPAGYGPSNIVAFYFILLEELEKEI
jgi:hypothetical protein